MGSKTHDSKQLEDSPKSAHHHDELRGLGELRRLDGRVALRLELLEAVAEAAAHDERAVGLVGALALLARVLQELLLDLRDERAEGAPLLGHARQHRPHLAQLLVAHLDLRGHVPARARRRAHLLARARDVLVRRPRERRREQARHDRVLADALEHLGDLGRLRVSTVSLRCRAR